MASINTDGSSLSSISLVESNLGLTTGLLNLNHVPASATNFGILSKTFHLSQGQYSFGWAYAAQDYMPFNDGVLFILSGNGANVVKILAANVSGQTDTVVVNSYGSTPWRTETFDITTDGNYLVAFGCYNDQDTDFNPILYVDKNIGVLLRDGMVVVSPSVIPPTLPTPQIFSPNNNSALNNRIIASVNIARTVSESATFGGDLGSGFAPSKTNSLDNYENFFKLLDAKGPINVGDEKNRVWVSPYYHEGINKATTQNTGGKFNSQGVVIGAETRDLKKNWTLGIMAGMGNGRQTYNQDEYSKNISRDLFYGAYFSRGFFKNARTDIIGNIIHTSHNNKRHDIISNGSSYIANGKFKDLTLSINAETSYKFRINQGYSIRPNIGFNLANDIRNGYTEKDGFLNGTNYNLTFDKKVTKTREIFSGIGARKEYSDDKRKYRLTGTYEIGYDLANQKNNTIARRNFTSSNPTISIENQSSSKITHYLNINASVHDFKIAFKVAVIYNGNFTKNQNNHTFSLKFEKRF